MNLPNNSNAKSSRPHQLVVATFVFGLAAGLAAVAASLEHRPVFIAAYFIFTFLAVAGFFVVKFSVANRFRFGAFAMVGVLIPAFSFCCLGLLIPNVSSVRNAAGRTEANGKLCAIACAIHSYHESKGHLPPPAIKDKNGRPMLSWRVAIITYIEHSGLYKRFKLDEPWDSPHNIALLDPMLRFYRSDYFAEPEEPHHTRVQALVGPGTAFDDDAFPITLKGSFPDGLDSTILLVEATRAVPWTKPEDVPYDRDGPFPQLGAEYNQAASLFGPKRIRAFHVVMVDGTRLFLQVPVDEVRLRACFLRNDGKGWWPQ